MIVVADSGPPHYLVLIQQIELLPRLFGRVLLPDTVRAELSQSRTPPAVRAWIHEPPDWLEVRNPSSPPDIAMGSLDPGEQQAIVLAREIRADYLLIDEFRGRAVARQSALPVIGTLGILLRAAHMGLIDFQEAWERLMQTNFRMSASLQQLILRRIQEGE